MAADAEVSSFALVLNQDPSTHLMERGVRKQEYNLMRNCSVRMEIYEYENIIFFENLEKRDLF